MISSEPAGYANKKIISQKDFHFYSVKVNIKKAIKKKKIFFER